MKQSVILSVNALVLYYSSSPVSASQISAGFSHTCVAWENRDIQCWGSNNYGELGYGDNLRRGDEAGEMGANLPFVELDTDDQKRVTQISTGQYSSCALTKDGKVQCWGNNQYEQLGIGTNGSTSTDPSDYDPVDLGTNYFATQIASGSQHSCVLSDTQQVKCFGFNNFGQLGYGDKVGRGCHPNLMGDNLLPVDVGSTGIVSELFSSTSRSCALFRNGNIKCWGYNKWGALGYGDTDDRGDDLNEMGDNLDYVKLGGDFKVQQLAMGLNHICALSRKHEIKCWGGNNYGQLYRGDVEHIGDESGEMGNNLGVVDFGDDDFVPIQITAGLDHTCALSEDKKVKCWGKNIDGQLGLGDTTNRGDQPSAQPLDDVNLGGSFQPVQISAGSSHTCALNKNDAVKCWGYNSNGQLGLEDTANRGWNVGQMGNNLPVAVWYDSQTTLSMGFTHSCVVWRGEEIQCWGSNNEGELGLGDTENRGNEPFEMGTNLPFVELKDSMAEPKQVTTGQYMTCALTKDGNVQCWGTNTNAQLALGTTYPTMKTNAADIDPIDLGFGFFAIQIATGSSHTCVLSRDLQVKCFGNNYFGQLGYGDTEHRGCNDTQLGDNLLAVDLGSTSKPIEIYAAGSKTCVLFLNGKVKCFGYNNFGSLGYGDEENRGDQSGQMGDNLPFIKLGSNFKVDQLAMGLNHICALSVDHKVKCWGANNYGQLGRNDSMVIGDESGELGAGLQTTHLGSNFVPIQISAGADHTCAVSEDKKVKCWGKNVDAQLGLGDTNNRGNDINEMGDNLKTVKLGSDFDVVAVVSGFNHNCALSCDEKVKCWGYNSNGQLGVGDTQNRGWKKFHMNDNLAVSIAYEQVMN